MPYAECILTIWFTSFNLHQGHRYKGEPWIGSSDLAVVYEVSIVQVGQHCKLRVMVLLVQSMVFDLCCVYSFTHVQSSFSAL